MRQVVGLDVIERIGKGHVTETVMVTVGFTVGGNVNQLGPVTVLRKTFKELLRERFAVAQYQLCACPPPLGLHRRYELA